MFTCIRTRQELIAWIGGEADDPELDEWSRFHVPGTRRNVYLPRPWATGWDETVESVAMSRGSSESVGPMTRERREDLCRTGDVWFVLVDDDGDYTINVVGEFSDSDLGLEAAARVASSFVIVVPGCAVSLWVDPDSEGGDDDIDDESWMDEDEEDDEDDEDDDDEDNEALAAWQRLTQITIIDDSGLVLVGPGAVRVMPSGSRWMVLPATDALISAMRTRSGDALLATMHLGGEARRVVVTDSIGRIVALRLGAALGHTTLFELDNDAIRALDCTRGVISATALRDRV